MNERWVEDLFGAIEWLAAGTGRLAKIATAVASVLERFGEALRELEKAEARRRVLDWEGVWLWDRGKKERWPGWRRRTR